MTPAVHYFNLRKASKFLFIPRFFMDSCQKVSYFRTRVTCFFYKINLNLTKKAVLYLNKSCKIILEFSV